MVFHSIYQYLITVTLQMGRDEERRHTLENLVHVGSMLQREGSGQNRFQSGFLDQVAHQVKHTHQLQKKLSPVLFTGCIAKLIKFLKKSRGDTRCETLTYRDMSFVQVACEIRCHKRRCFNC